MKRLLALGLSLILIFGMTGTAMAGSGKGEKIRVKTENRLQVEAEDSDKQEGQEGEQEEVQREQEGEHEEANQADDGDKLEETEEDLPQGAVHGLLTIDYKVPGGDKGTMTLVAKRGSVEETFEAQIPLGLTDEQTIAFIEEAFKAQIQKAFGLQGNSFKVLDYQFNVETSVTTATVLVIPDKAPVTGTELPSEAAAGSHGESKDK